MKEETTHSVECGVAVVLVDGSEQAGHPREGVDLKSMRFHPSRR